ncbi:hypothetical protein ABLE93_10745 [Xanthobacter sp. KR7-65]
MPTQALAVPPADPARAVALMSAGGFLTSGILVLVEILAGLPTFAL